MDKQKKVLIGSIIAVVFVFGTWFVVNNNNKNKDLGTESVLI